MPDINVPYDFTVGESSLISSKMADADFKHTNWGDEDLLEIRKKIRDHYRTEQLGVCSFCRNTVSLQSTLNSHVEHIAPKSLYRNFMFEPKNLCVICADCNAIKRDQEVMQEMPNTVVNGGSRRLYPRSSNAFKIVHPFFDDYDKHIVQLDSLYFDLTPKGHFTIGACRLNRFVHQFGWNLELLDLPEFINMTQGFLNATDPRDQRKKLLAIQKIMMRVKI